MNEQLPDTLYTEYTYALEDADWNYKQTGQPQPIYQDRRQGNVYYVNPRDIEGLLLLETIGVD